ncbi:MAG: hypothetical protein HKN00_09135 [Flavobacteriaceae bacterium]|nr:hypothetical protein [Bacteroidia bacterium]MBT8288679.1 hypothetical protein [Bacteroidia bacterium]NNF75334.1 hypothetical protein [Flavobacteriaceae bacterium]NNK73207.1 hypothetical protein [Flavobacteriaceae bacterium]
MFRTIAMIIMACALTGSTFAQQIGNVQRGQRGYAPSIQYNESTYIEIKDPVKESQRILEKCLEVFALDAFQQEIFKGMMTKKIEDDNVILNDKVNSREDRRKKLSEREKIFFKELGSILNDEQVEDYKLMDFTETKEDRKKKKKRKRKNKSD